jgi:hypothetical protein
MRGGPALTSGLPNAATPGTPLQREHLPMPFLFPIAGLIISGTGLAMIVKYIQSDKETRSFLDNWMTDAAKLAVRTYLRMRYGLDLGSLTPAEEKEYWRQFGTRLDSFVALAEPISMNVYSRPFANLTGEEQAEVARRVAHLSGEPA